MQKNKTTININSILLVDYIIHWVNFNKKSDKRQNCEKNVIFIGWRKYIFLYSVHWGQNWGQNLSLKNGVSGLS